MKFIKKWSGSRNSNNTMIVLAVVVVVAIAVIGLVVSLSGPPKQALVLQEGKDYDIDHSGNVYTIVDEVGNTIELQRVSSEVFQDRQGKQYKFVSGSPFKYIGEYKK